MTTADFLTRIRWPLIRWPLIRRPRLRAHLVVLVLASALPPFQSVAAQTLTLSSATIEDLNAAFDAGTLTSERLIELYLARIEAYDQRGPALNAVLHLNAGALAAARALDAERRATGPRSPLHGIPVVLKDNIDTSDMPTTAGSLLLAGSIPPDDAFIVKKLRDAGAIILAKLNMSEFASGVTMSSVGGFIRNPHDIARTPSGSSGGTGAAIAAAYGQLGIGTDTGGSVRGPTTSNGIAGLKPTHGLLSRDGIVPLALSFDIAGPMARHVYDVAAMLSVMTGIDPADEATRKSAGVFETDYTEFLDAGALSGARIGIARDFLGSDTEVDWIVEASLQAMRDAGATVVDVRLPQWLLDVKGDWYTTIRWREFRAQIPDYLATIGPEYPKTLQQMIERSLEITSTTPAGGTPNPTRWSLLMQEEASGALTDYEYVAMRDHGLAMVRGIVEGLMDADRLDAIVYPTSPTRPALVEGATGPAGGASPTDIANLTGFPDLIVPAGFTSNRLPVGISFLGRAFAEPRLFGLGYAFEQATQVRRDPGSTPPLRGEEIRR
ncbi:MAG TPA: glutamyl-tRNA amidotransferase [Gemmatimonadetes bacterium]|nr:glutamyl-tRNA amidotransferase [Gemmatimonadota bacterium]